MCNTFFLVIHFFANEERFHEKSHGSTEARPTDLIRQNFEAENFARLAFDDDFKGAAANFAIGGEALAGLGGVDGQVEGLAAEGALDGFGGFHALSFV
jgi:hypothetical protein